MTPAPCPHCGCLFSDQDSRCPRCGELRGAAPLPGTRMESVEDLRRWAADPAAGTRMESVEDLRRWAAASPGSHPPSLPVAAAIPADSTPAYRPLHRPPMLLLCVLDDGTDSGEWIRIRAGQFVIGRSAGDLQLPHDSAVSTRHCQFVRGETDGRITWFLEDLQSTNGTFIRVGQAVLHDKQEIAIGNRRLVFHAATAPGAELAKPAASGSTRPLQALAPAALEQLAPALEELTAAGDGRRQSLLEREYWIGSDPSCAQIVIKDSFVSPRHAQITCDASGRWQIRDGKSRNGTWLRIRRLPLSSSAEVQIGEQRLLVRISSREN